MNLEQRRSNIRKKRRKSAYDFMLIFFTIVLVVVVIGAGKFDYQAGLAIEQTKRQEEATKKQIQKDKEEELFLKEIERLMQIEKLYGELTIYTKLDEAKEQAIKEYFNQIGGAGVLEDKVNIFIHMAKIYNIDVFRTIAIALLESDKGTSYAATSKQHNISGMNNIPSKYTNVYNIREYDSIDQSIHHLTYKLATLYRDKWGLVTLSQIQTKYAPSNDPRNGLDGMNNTKWTSNTIQHYKGMEKIYNRLKEDLL